jgi:competence protein ComEC
MGLLAGFTMWANTRLLRLFPNVLLYIPAQQGGAFLALLPVILYCFISGFQPPAVRACLMTVVLFSSFIFRRQWHGPTAIAIAALILLVHNPLLLNMVSFQLTFMAVTAIIFILPVIKNKIFQKEKPLSWFTICKYTVISGLLVSLVASIATLPLLLFHFNRVSLISPLTTLIMEPLLCLWALGFGLAGSVCLFLDPSLADILLHIGSLGLSSALWIGSMINQIPHLTLWFTTPAVWKILGYYLSLALFSIFRNKRAAFCFIICFSFLFIPQSRNLDTDKVTIIDVGKGNSSLVESRSGKVILIDCGGPHSETFNVGRQIIAPFLFHKQIRHIDLLVLSHADLDHYSGAAFLIHHFHPKELWIPYIHADNNEWKMMIRAARNQKTIIKIPRLKTSYPLDKDNIFINISQAHLIHKDWSQNEQSLVLRYNSGKYSFLFPGDIEEKSEHLLLQQDQHLQSTVIIAPHHGSKSSSTIPFIEKVQPQYVVFSASLYGSIQFPAPEIVERYKKINTIPLLTAVNGAIVFTLNPEHLDIDVSLP